ncbi:H/ACA ribonucleoprotein complex subunit GAR1 [Thermosphaera chiliense]|uniref:H/ACA ribonucleoprotein complex subunit GAR1 n=1 Tax=Thermosphaera chiliense TaxID=3402707 RepID=UPI001D09F22C|nr:Gar1/Naf1 family protein [Thermosphaera aggregans]
MKKLGRVEQVTRDGNLIIICETPEASRIIGLTVYDEEMRRIGKIVDVIGRVEEPRIVVKLENLETASTVKPGTVYYYKPAPEKRPRRSGRRSGR